MTPTDSSTSFVTWVASLTERTPAARSALRSGLGRKPEECDRMHGYVAPRLTENTHPHTEHAFYTVASLIAHEPAGAAPEASPGNLGASMAHATRARALAANTTENFVHLLARQTDKTIYKYLVTATIPLRNEHIPVDFAVLLDDLVRWPWRQQDITKRWLQSYYRALPTAP